MKNDLVFVVIVGCGLCLAGASASAAEVHPMELSIGPQDRVVRKATAPDGGLAAKAQVAIVDEDFEAGFPSTWDVRYGDVEAWWDLSSYRAASGLYSAYCAAGGSAAAPDGGPYPPNMRTWMIYGPFTLADATAATTDMDLWADIEAPSGDTYYDYLFWGVSVDGTNFSGWRMADVSDGWYHHEWDLSTSSTPVLGVSQVWFAVSFTSDGSIEEEGAYVDNIQVEKTVASAPCTLTCSASAPGSAEVGQSVSFQASATPSNCSGTVAYAWTFGDGGTSTSRNPSHAYGAAGTFPWTMTATIEDKSCSRNGTITVSESQPPEGVEAYWIPVASHWEGANDSQWRTDLSVLNAGTAAANLQLRFHGSSGVLTTSAAVGAGAQKVFTDVVALFNTVDSGALEVRSDRPVRVMSRTYTQEANGDTFGQDLIGMPPSDALSEGLSAVLPQLTENSAYRTNIAVTNTGDTQAKALVELFDGSGDKLHEYTVTLAPGEWQQKNRPFFNLAGQSAMAKGWARVTVTQGAGVQAYASVLDAASNDPTTISMRVDKVAGVTEEWVSVASHATGENNSQWRTDLGLLNLGGSVATAELRLHLGSGVLTDQVSVAAGTQKLLVDVVESRFGTSGTGALEVIADQPLSVTSRTYTQEATGKTYGQDFEGVGSYYGVGPEHVVHLPQLVENDKYRSNIAFTNTGPEPASVTVELYTGDGTMIKSFDVDNIQPGKRVQENRVFYNRAGRSNIANGFAKVYHKAGHGVLVIGSVVDWDTDDPTTIPMVRAAEMPAAYTVVTNPSTSKLLNMKSMDGVNVGWFGGRDESGIPTSIDNVVVTSPTGEDTEIKLDEEFRPVRIRAYNGTVFEFSYLPDDQVVVSAVSPDGTAQVNTTFPLWQLPKQGEAGCSTCEHPRRRDSVAAPLPPVPAPVGGSFNAKTFAGESACTVHVNRCGEPVTDASVVVYLSVPGDLLSSWQGPADHEGNGEYVAFVPTNREPSLDGEALRSAAENIAWLLGQACTALSLSGDPEIYLASFCPAIGVALTTVTGPGGPAIGAACAAVSVAVAGYCRTLGEGGFVGGDSLAERILQGLQDPMVLTGLVHLKADSWIPGLLGADVSPEVTASAAGPFPDLFINVEDMARIASLTLSPASPAAGQDYTATTVIGCALAGDDVNMRVVGTDGYTQSQDFTVSAPGDQSFSITVPGAAEGVSDTITVTLHRSNGTQETRTASLVFGGGI